MTDRTETYDDAVRRALAFQGADPADWVIPREGVTHNVFIVGAGQSGIALRYALRRAGVGRVGQVDAAGEDSAGSWDRCARMLTLRTPKTATGPDLGFTPLGFQRWYDAQQGPGAFAALDRVPPAAWSGYLRWFRNLTAGGIRYQTRLVGVEPMGAHFRLHLAGPGGDTVETTRKLVLTGGIEALGGPHVPSELEALPPGLLAHTSAAIDFAALRGRTVAVIGCGASAFDAAATALEAGALRVRMLTRRDAIPDTAGGRKRRYHGAQENFPALPDSLRWKLALRMQALGTPPPLDSILRVMAHDNFGIHLSAPLDHAEVRSGRASLIVRGDVHDFDFVIAATGYRQDPRLRPELTAIADRIALWGDRYVPPVGQESPGLASHPYLGPEFQLTEKVPRSAPFLKNLHAYTTAAQLSFGRHISDVPSMDFGIRRLTAALVRDLFFEDEQAHHALMDRMPPPDWSAECYARAVLPLPSRRAAGGGDAVR